ncbi:MAG: carbon-monoxide dehydrogenase large subunit [Alphaproteobacteria bacterium]
MALIGASIRRVEDQRLLTGAGRYTDDINRSGQAYAVFVRSPHAHADILSIDTGIATKMPGVLGIFTIDDLAASAIGEIPTGIAGRGEGYPNRDGSAMANPPYLVLAKDRVRYVGEPVAMVVATGVGSAVAAAEAVAITYRALAPVIGADQADLPDKPQIWPEAPRNTCYDWGAGDAAAVAQALENSHHVTALEVEIGRIVPAFMEPRAALADYDAATHRFEIFAGCQAIHGLRDKLAVSLGVAPDRVRVISPDVGGAFGARSVIYPEYLATLWAAREMGRPIKWTSTREEEFLTSTQGRDSFLRGELGLDDAGRFLGLRVTGQSNMGARHTGNGPYSVMRNLARMLPGVYRTPAVCMALRGVFTNTVPVSSYRGVGRMEAIFLMERLVDRAAREIGTDRIALRRQNLIATTSLPYKTPMGAVYDSGDYASNMDKAMAAAHWNAFPDRRAKAQRSGLWRGIGLANYIEGAGGGAGEYVAIGIDENGIAQIGAGCVDQGQGHRTSLRQIAADRLGLGLEQVAVCASDTDLIKDGVGTNASRSMVRAGAALVAAADQLIEIGRPFATGLLQAQAGEVTYHDGRYHLDGGRSVGLNEVARAAREAGAGSGKGEGLFAEIRSDDDAATYPNGCHICEVEIDPETGAVEVIAFTAVDDVGRAINPPIVHGQSQGGIAQGIGQALMEWGVFDPVSGQVLSGSFVDYAMPRAKGLPPLHPIANDFPSPTNALGVKGAGEGGATGAPAAVINAVLDALAPHGVTDITMPATAARIWAAIQRDV